MLNGIFINEFNEIYLKLWERGLNGIYFIIYLIIMFELVMNELYSNINSKFDKSIVVRVGYSKYYIHSVVKVFFTSIAYAYSSSFNNNFNEYIHEFDYMKTPEDLMHIYFSNNVYINLSIFVLLSSVGTGIYFVALYTFFSGRNSTSSNY